VTPRRLTALERLPQAIAEQVVKRIVEVIDVDEIVRRVDVNDIVRRVDVNALMARVDVDEVVERVDANALVEKVDPNALMDRVDLDRLLDRIDVNAIAAKIDVDAIAKRIDMDELVRRADLGPIIAQSTSGMVGEFLGLLRRQVVSLDALLDRVTLHRRRAEGKPQGPAGLVAASTARGVPTREGEYAGGVTRLLAFLADVGAIWGIFAVFTAGFQAAVRLFLGDDFTLFNHRPGGIIAYVVWAFCYFTFQWALSGRTIGMAILGARVVTSDGHSVSAKQAAIRTLVLPVSLVLWFFFIVGIELRADRKTLHDRAAGTTVVYFWEARGASMPWLHADEKAAA
jgi:uncharacterized RDD family membrane protein YckC